MARKMALQAEPNHQFQFTRKWFHNRNLGTFRDYVHPEFNGKETKYFEIGVFEGMSMCWMLQHVLTHPKSKALGVDPWLATAKLDQTYMDEVQARARHNTKVWRDRCDLQRYNSVELCRIILRKGYKDFKAESVDIAQIDGDHTDLAAWSDARFVYEILKPGGWMLWDDVENDREKANHVKQGLAKFMEEYEGKVKEIWRHKYMVCLQKAE